MNYEIHFLLGVSFGLVSCGTAAAQDAARPGKSPASISVFASSEEKHKSLAEKPALAFRTQRTNALTIFVDATTKYQEIDGFGASVSESSAYLLKRKLTDAQRTDALRMLFDRQKGIGLSMLRQPMGASDFALQAYSYDEMSEGESDPDLKKFSIDHDRADILPVLKEILAINPKIKVIGSPWSAPGWMKTSGAMIQGSLLPSAYDANAQCDSVLHRIDRDCSVL
jgi:glucosylceramidase